jgi:energy-coupling factor transporter ATP-binding protein EcfA2
MPSGGLTGTQLSLALCREVSQDKVVSSNLAEASSLLEHQYGRAVLVEKLKELLDPMQPDGGLVGFARLPWARIYTTNYDELVERAFIRNGRSLTVVRSNRDFARLDKNETELLKIHGCISRDRGFGHADSMVLSEEDYLEYDSYREALFGKLTFDLNTKDVIIIGHSLSDPHLKTLLEDVAKRARSQSGTTRLFMLLYSADSSRIELLAQRNIHAAVGSLSEMLDAITPIDSETSPATGATPVLPRKIVHRTIDCSQSSLVGADATRLFNGSSASHADIASGLTFRRGIEDSIVETLRSGNAQFVTILGASGTGKSTLARRVLALLTRDGHVAYEHKSEFDLDSDTWSSAAADAQARGQRLVLLVDEAAGHLTALNRLVRELVEHGLTSLQIILTAHGAQWTARSRSPYLQKNGRDFSLSTLTQSDIEALVDLCRSEPKIKELVQSGFANKSRVAQIEAVRGVCSADMFVALKYCFPGEEVDRIVLSEFAEMESLGAEVYKTVALLEASHGTPSRQLIMEVLGISWNEIDTVLGASKGILTQRVVDARDGIYTWSSRHRVIAEVIAFYKFDDQTELVYLLGRIIQALNASMLLDRHLVPALCDNTYAIGRVESADERIRLLEMLAKRSNNRVPWHRLISTLLRENDIPNAARAISRAETAVGLDPPIHRYKITLELRRAEKLKELGTDDYLALINNARRDAEWAIERWPQNKYTYMAFADVAREIFKATGNRGPLDTAAEWMRDAYEEILDVDLLRWAGEIHSVETYVVADEPVI